MGYQLMLVGARVPGNATAEIINDTGKLLTIRIPDSRRTAAGSPDRGPPGRGRCLHLGYLLDAQTKVGAWSDTEMTMRQIAPMVSDVASTRGVVLLARILPELQHEHVPGSTRETTDQLALLLSQTNM